MLKIDRKGQRFTRLEAPGMATVSLSERYDLQEFISNSPEAFFAEMGMELFLLGKEVQPSSTVSDRIDLLAVDKEGRIVVLELKRGNHQLHMLQAISYSGMISKLSPGEVLQGLSDQQRQELEQFLEVDVDDLNREQQIVLVAEDFDYALLVGAEWLSEQYGVNVTCCRIAIAVDPTTKSEYLICSNIFPAPELAKEAIVRRRKPPLPDNTLPWPDWPTALAGITNPAVVQFFEQELERNQESYLRKRILRYRIQGKRRWFLAARKVNAYLWQQARFDNDIEFWRKGLSEPEEVKPVKEGQCLRMFLSTASDFAYFLNAATKTLQTVEWHGGLQEEGLAESEMSAEEEN